MTTADRIDQLQQRLIALAADKTRQLEMEIQAERRKRLPDPTSIKIRRTAS